MSIHIGMDRLEPSVYRSLLADLEAAEADARAMRDIADAMGCATRVLLSEEAARDTVRAELESVVERLQPGDLLLLSYSGHMVQLDGVGDDRDGGDEAWCLYDGVLIDDELHRLLAPAPADVEIVVVTDACFAEGIIDARGRATASRATSASGATTVGGVSPTPTARVPLVDPMPGMERAVWDLSVDFANPTVLMRGSRAVDPIIASLVRSRQIPSGLSDGVRGPRPTIHSRIIHLAAASEESLAFEGDKQGFFTAALLHTLQTGEPNAVPYSELMEEIAELVQFQTPQITLHGSADASMLDAPAFAAQSRPRPIRGTERLRQARG